MKPAQPVTTALNSGSENPSWIATLYGCLRQAVHRLSVSTILKSDMTESKRPRIAHVIDSLDTSGGAEKQLVANLRSFDHGRIQHDLVLLRPSSETRVDEVPDEVRVTVLFDRGQHPDRVGAFRRLRHLVSSANYDLIHAALPDSALAARAVGLTTPTRVVESLVNISHEPIRTVDNPAVTLRKLALHRFVDGLTMRGVDRFHAVSRAVADSWVSVVGIDARRIEVIPRGIDHQSMANTVLTPAERAALRLELDVDPDSPLVLSVGRLEPQKGHRYLIEGVKLIQSSVPNLRVLIVGREGNSSAFLKDLIKKLGLERMVRLIGARRDVARLMAASDVFAFPSLFEGNGGNAMIEAMATGLPIVTTNEAPMTDLVPDERYGILCPRTDSQAIGEALKKLIEDPRLRERLGAAARERASGFSTPAEIASRFETWYLSLMEGSSPPR